MRKSHDVYLQHIKDEIAFLRSLPEFSDGSSLKDDAVLSRAGIPWRRIIALRNRLIHDYMGINYNIVVNVLREEIPKLAEQLEGLLQIDGFADNPNHQSDASPETHSPD